MPAIEVKGGPELRRALQGLEVDLRDLSALHRSIARVVVQAVSSIAPVDSGKLAGSFRPSGTRTTAKARSSLIYAPIQNYGWPAHNIKPRHFAELALAHSTGQIRHEYDQGIAKLCRKAET